MKYSKNRHYRDQEKIIKKEIISLGKRIKKSKKKKEGLLKNILNWFKGDK